MKTKFLLCGILFCLCHSSIMAEKSVSSLENERNHFQVVFNQEYYPTLKNLIQNSQKSISIVGLSMRAKYGKCQSIVRSLKKAQKRGVKIQVFLEGDSHGGWRNKQTLALLKKVGIVGKYDSKKRLTHAKLVLVDDHYVLIGSTNLTHNSMSNNNESNLLVHSSQAVSFYRKYFEHLWHFPERSWLAQEKSPDGSTYFTSSNYFDIIGKLIDEADEEINLMTYMMKLDNKNPNHTINLLLEKLIEAKKRGVVVKIVLEQCTKGSFNDHVHYYNKGSAAFLLENGITDIVFDDPKKLTHSKILWIDGKEVVIGSSNWFRKEGISQHQAGIATQAKNVISETKDYFESIYQAGEKYKGQESFVHNKKHACE